MTVGNASEPHVEPRNFVLSGLVVQEIDKFERVLVVSAHPDDPEFGFGATVARLTDQGADVRYVICTDGSQGGEDPTIPDEELSATRYEEQRKAAKVLGVRDVEFFGYRDGHLVADLELRRKIVREIRRHRPELVLTQSPVRRLTPWGIGAFHPDHQAVGEATLQAVYPDARNPRAFRELLAEDLQPHIVKEVWVPALNEGDHLVDATPYFDRKLEAVLCHQSQFGKPHQDAEGPDRWLREWMGSVGERAGLKYAEAFFRMKTA
jgi:LmbE family N-acetylglucosaminyl deacetylase